MISSKAKQIIIKKYGINTFDTGNSSIQIALLTQNIVFLANHLKNNKKDYVTKRRLLKLVARRKKFLLYLQKTDNKQYHSLIKDLKLRK